MALYDYQIAVNYDNAAGLVNIETIVPSSDRAFYPPVAYGSYTPGVRKVRGDRKVFVAGYGYASWIWAVLTRAQYEYLQDTYCAGGWSGFVTVRTRIGRRTYANYNATLVLPFPAETDREYLVWRNCKVEFVGLRPI